MANFSLTERVSCPFNPVHVIERRRLQVHIVKCKRNLPANHDFLQCPFWHLHYVRRSEFKEHIATCDHRLQKEACKIAWETETPKFKEPKLMVDEAMGQDNSSENWDDIAGPTFQPDQMMAAAIHMTVPQGLSKSKRKEFRDKERERLRELEDKKINLVIKKEKTDGPLDPQPRKPTENSVQRLGRLAAIFPPQKQSTSNVKEEADETFSSNSTRGKTSYGHSSNLIGGRGRVLAGWSSSADNNQAFRISSEDFPKL